MSRSLLEMASVAELERVPGGQGTSKNAAATTYDLDEVGTRWCVITLPAG